MRRRRRSTMVGYVSPVAYLRRATMYRGFFKGERAWLVLGLVMWSPRVIRKVSAQFGRQEEVVAVEKLTAGQFVRLEAISPPTRRQRKAAKRAS